MRRSTRAARRWGQPSRPERLSCNDDLCFESFYTPRLLRGYMSGQAPVIPCCTTLRHFPYVTVRYAAVREGFRNFRGLQHRTRALHRFLSVAVSKSRRHRMRWQFLETHQGTYHWESQANYSAHDIHDYLDKNNTRHWKHQSAINEQA